MNLKFLNLTSRALTTELGLPVATIDEVLRQNASLQNAVHQNTAEIFGIYVRIFAF